MLRLFPIQIDIPIRAYNPEVSVQREQIQDFVKAFTICKEGEKAVGRDFCVGHHDSGSERALQVCCDILQRDINEAERSVVVE